MASKGNDPQMALIQVGELLYIIYPDIYAYAYVNIYIYIQ